VNDVVIRRGGPGDFGPAYAVWRAAETARRGGRPIGPVTEERVRGYRCRPGAFLFVADSAEGLVGMLLATPATSHPRELCVVQMVFVLPERWGRGIGGRLLDAALAEAESRGYERAQLSTHAADPRAAALYAGRGFVRSGSLKVGELGESMARYERLLQDPLGRRV
jgi:GNAT superfamily N-acetyltransferase